MAPFPTGSRLIAFAFLWAALFSIGAAVAWVGAQPIAAGVGALVAVGLIVRAILLIVSRKTTASDNASDSST